MKIERTWHAYGSRRPVTSVYLQRGEYAVMVPPFVTDEAAERILRFVQDVVLEESLKAHASVPPED